MASPGRGWAIATKENKLRERKKENEISFSLIIFMGVIFTVSDKANIQQSHGYTSRRV